MRFLVPLSMAVVAGCLPDNKRGFDAPDPTARLQAITEAAKSNDASAVPDLIDALEASDPAARFLAINALERITGERLGYRHAAPEVERREAVDRWVEWATARGLVYAPAGPGEAAGPESGEAAEAPRR